MGITPPLFFLFFLGVEGNGFFLSEVGVDLEEGGDYEGDGAARHDDDEEQAITHHVLEIAREHAGKHEAEIGNARTDGIMGGLEFALAVEEHVEGEDGEAQAIAELLDKQTGGNHDEVGVERVAQEDVDSIGQRDRHDHGPQPLLHAVAAHQDAADDAAQEESDESDGAIGEAIFLGRESQSAL